MMNRREVLSIGVSAAAAAVLITADARSEEARPFQVVDTNVSLFHWPFRRLPLDETELFVKKFRSLGIQQLWAGSFEGVLHRDVAGVNQRLANTCAKYPELIPIGTVNLALPDWEEDVRRCFEVHKMPGIRLQPGYHGYQLDDPKFKRLLELAATAKRFVQIATALEDTRTQHEMYQIPDVDVSPLAKVVEQTPGAIVQLLNHKLRGTALDALAQTPGIYFDTARVDGTDGVFNLRKQVGAGRVLFGSHAPFLVPEAALIRAHESSTLDQKALRSVLAESAQQLLKKVER